VEGFRNGPPQKVRVLYTKRTQPPVMSPELGRGS
jgi:hypothetical protein